MKKKKIIYYFLSFIIPIALFSIICFISNYYPFGDNLLNKYDSWSMYPSILIEYIKNIKSGESIFYTFHAALGTNLISIINLYMGSPLNLLFIFFKSNQVYLFFVILIYLKVGLSSLCLFIYFQHKNFQTKNSNLLFSCIYALSSFLIGYNYHIMWSDAFYLAPLILLGIDKIIDENKTLIYIIFLTLSMIINFYTAFMLCIFSVLYFIYRILNINEKKKEKIIKFIMSSFLCAFFSAFILIPSAIALLKGRSPDINNYFSFNIPNLKSLFYNLLPGSFLKTDNFNDGSCVICPSIFVVVLVILYFLNNNISKQKRLTVASILLFLGLSLILCPLDYFWNMLAKPVWWNSRYSFLIILFMIIIAHESFNGIDKIKIKSLLKSLILLILIFIFIVSFSLKLYGTQPSIKALYIFFASLLLFILYYYFLPKGKKVSIFIIPLVILEILFNNYYILNLDKNPLFMNTMKDINKKQETLKKISDMEQNNFYRIFDYNDSQEDDGLFNSYNSVNLFSSIYNNKVNQFYSKKLVLNELDNETINHTKIEYPNIESLSLLNVKYIMSFNNKNNNIIDCHYKDFCINQYALPLGFLINNNQTLTLKNNDSLKNVEKIYSYLLNKNISLYESQNMSLTLKNLKMNKNKITLSKKKKNGTLILKFNVSKEGIISPNINSYFYSNNYNIIINGQTIKKNMLIYVNKGDNVQINFKYTNNYKEINLEHLKVKILDLEKFQMISEKLSEESIKIKESKDHLLKGTIHVNSNKKLFMTIPFDKGLIVKVDNKRVKVNEEFGVFISIPLKEGSHTITVDYIPQGLLLGSSISIISLITYLFLGYSRRSQK